MNNLLLVVVALYAKCYGRSLLYRASVIENDHNILRRAFGPGRQVPKSHSIVVAVLLNVVVVIGFVNT